METISSSDAKQNFGATLDAAQRHPVVIRKHNRDVAVLLSMTEYEKLRALNWQMFNSLADKIGADARARGLTDEILDELIADVS